MWSIEQPFAGVDSEIDVNIMSSKAKLHINDDNNDDNDDDDDAPDDNEYEANEGKISLTSPPKIGRMTTVDKNPDSSVPFDPVTTTCYSPTTEVARCITRSCNEKGMIMEHGHELLQQIRCMRH